MKVYSRFGSLEVAHWKLNSMSLDFEKNTAIVYVALFASTDAEQPFLIKEYNLVYDDTDPENQALYDQIKTLALSKITANLNNE